MPTDDFEFRLDAKTTRITERQMLLKCGARPPDVELEVDHIVPVSRAGTSDLANLRTLCCPCNQGKKDR